MFYVEKFPQTSRSDKRNGNSGNNLPGKFNNYLYVHKNRHFDNKPRL